MPGELEISGTAGVCDSFGDIFLFLSTSEIARHGIKKKRDVGWTLFFPPKMCIIEVLTIHNH